MYAQYKFLLNQPGAPGIFTDEQIQAWKPIVKSAHAKGAYFVCQRGQFMVKYLLLRCFFPNFRIQCFTKAEERIQMCQAANRSLPLQCVSCYIPWIYVSIEHLD